MLVLSQLESLQIPYLGDLLVVLRYWSCLLSLGVVGLEEFDVGKALGVSKVRDHLFEAEHLCPLLFLTPFAKRHVGLVVELEG